MRPFLLVLALLAATLRPAMADGFTPPQRDEIVRIVRDALKTDPSIVRDALLALQAEEARKKDSVASDVIGLLGPRLIDPADASAGNPFASVTVIEFYDTRCPYCRRMLPTLAALVQADPDVRVVFKDWPILGTASQLESRALLAAQRQGGYLKLRDAIMQGPAQSGRDSVRDLAASLGLDGMQLLRDMDDPAIKTRLANNLDLARELGLQGTPALVIGRQVIGGAVELDELRHAVAAARAAK